MIDFQTLQDLSAGAAEVDTTCPLCSASRKPFNRKKKVLKIWNPEPGFATFNCTHCGAAGHARDENGHNGKSNGKSRASEDDIAKALMAAIPSTPQPRQPRQEWIYKTEDGTPYLRVERVVRNGGKSYPQSHWNGDGWENGKPKGPKIPYRLPELVKSPGQPVFICEGEKCADAVASLGWLATSASEGAGKWKSELNKWFEGRVVYILPDNDNPGHAHAGMVARNLNGVASEVRVVKLEGLGDGEDVFDWIKREQFPENLLRIAEDTPLWEPSPETELRDDTHVVKALAEALRLQAAPVAVQAPTPATITVNDFYAYMPMHNYIFVLTRDTWPSSSINARIPPIACGGEIKIKASDWLDKFKPIEQMTWIPGEPMVIKDRFFADGGFIKREGITVFNLYREPTINHGDADKAYQWVDHLHRVFGDDADHIIRWLAHRVQRPFEKVNHALVLGGAQGIGKDTALEPVKHAIGPWNFVEVSPQHMLARFNGFLKSVILRISEARDLGESDRFKFYDHSKAYIAAPPDVLRIDEKHLHEYAIPNVAGVIITTNHKTDGIFLPEDDRRHFVAWSELTRDSFDEAYWTTLWRWYYGEGGNGHVAAYLASLDISGFDPKAPPRKTQAFWEIVDASRSPEDAEMQTAIDRLGAPNALTISEIINQADADFALYLRDRKNARRIPHRLEACGYVAVRNDNAKAGRWKVQGRDMVIYAKASLPIRDRIVAARKLAGW